jgi:glycerol-3-phosphate dehydrogenase
MWQKGYRDILWSQLSKPWDVVIIGGGITGAGILKQASQAGLRALLVEAKDFAFGTSSRSSKLVHGGLRYLQNRQYNVTYESVRERERMLREGPNLVEPLKFFITSRSTDHTPAWKFGLGVVIYDLMGSKWANGHISAQQLVQACPAIGQENLLGAYYYYDAVTDDSRLVLRVVREAVMSGGKALNYARAVELLTDGSGQVTGIVLQDQSPEGQGRTCDVLANVVINATGPFADELRGKVGGQARIRKQRGSHILFKRSRFPIQSAFTLVHPWDNRVFFAIPWEGTTLVGTTDLDHPAELERATPEPCITADEVKYLMAALQYTFPDLGLTQEDIISSFAGLRPIVKSGEANHPSQESRNHIILNENGLITITGGKLTTYRRMAYETLQAAKPHLHPRLEIKDRQPMFEPLPHLNGKSALLPAEAVGYLSGRYGLETPRLIQQAETAELAPAANEIPTLWAELRWAAREEGVVHLDDLLLRRVRLGLLTPNGGLDQIETIRQIVQNELGWGDERWEQELAHYRRLWQQCYFLPEGI